MKTRSLEKVEESESRPPPRGSLESSDGHPQSNHNLFDIDLYPLDRDEVQRELEIDQPFSEDFLGIEMVADEGHPDCCACHICSPIEVLECKDMLDAIRRGLVTLAYAIKELGEVFRHFLEIEDPELAEQAIAYS